MNLKKIELLEKKSTHFNTNTKHFDMLKEVSRKFVSNAENYPKIKNNTVPQRVRKKYKKTLLFQKKIFLMKKNEKTEIFLNDLFAGICLLAML